MDVPTNTKPLEWNEQIEQLCKRLGEKALSLSILHSDSERHYSRRNTALSIPVIVLSSATGLASVGFGSIQGVSIGLGIVSLITGVLQTLNSFFGYAKKSEGHRITSISYHKLYLQLSVQLALPARKRIDAKTFLRMISETIERLNEISPSICDEAIAKYHQKFEHYIGMQDGPAIPEQVNGLVTIPIYRDPTKDDDISTVPPESSSSSAASDDCGFQSPPPALESLAIHSASGPKNRPWK